jgi:hypothetical protein
MTTAARQPLSLGTAQDQVWMCDVQGSGDIVPFLRLFRFEPDGSPGTPPFLDLDESGAPYTVTGTPTNCGEAIAGAFQSGYGGDPIYTRVSGNYPAAGSSHTTDPTARRVQVFWTSTAASLGSRASVLVAGAAETELPNNVGLITFGTLDSITQLGYTIELRTNQNNDDAGILEEF